MNKKIKKLLYELSKNSRITTKLLGKRLRTSQQSASYLLNQLKKKKVLQGSVTIVDPVKLGFSNVIVGFNYTDFSPQTKKDVLENLRNTDSVIRIEEAKQGVDLFVEYCVPNFSAFNKTYIGLVHKFYKSLTTKFILPIIVKHKYHKNYLVRKAEQEDIILCGDRKLVDLSPLQLRVLKILVEQPDQTITGIARAAQCSARSAVAAKKKLQRLETVRGYTSIIDNSKVGIQRSFLFLKLSGKSIGEIQKLVEFARAHKNITELMKIIGNFDVMLTIETLEETDVIMALRSEFSVEDYLLVESEHVHKLKYLPDLDQF